MWLATLTFQMRSHCSSGTSTPPMAMMPALAQNRSMSPWASSVAATSASTWASSPASTLVAVAVPPAAVMSAATRRAPASSMSATATAAAPLAAKARHRASPMPPPPPVTTTTLPAMSIRAISWGGSGSAGEGSAAPGDEPGHVVGVGGQVGVLGQHRGEALAGGGALVGEVLGRPEALVRAVALEDVTGD